MTSFVVKLLNLHQLYHLSIDFIYFVDIDQTIQKIIDIKLPILINCDMGEWDAPHLINQDHLIMPLIDLCNIACGGHAGSEEIIVHTIELAIDNEVKIGAHPGYADKSNFGRTYVEMKESDLKDLLHSQIDLFLNLAEKMNALPYHIKPHGALYHACNHRETEMNILIDIIKQEYSYLTLLVFPDSILHRRAEAEQLNFIAESFIDRSYTKDLKLVSRKKDGAVIKTVNKARAQFEHLSNGKVNVQGDSIHQLKSQTACIHGDNPNVLEILESINS
jgi:UPF0271 protein